MEIWGYLALVLVGLLLGVMGGGGSILSVPILVYIFSLDVIMASAYSLFIVGATSLIGSVIKHQNRLVDIRIATMLGLPSIMTTFITRKWIVCAIPDVIICTESLQITKRALILSTFAVVLVLASVAMITGSSRRDEPLRAMHYVLIPIGVFVGLLSGLVGVGGGFLILPAMVLVARLPFNTAVGTTLLVITFNSLFGFMGDVINHPVDWSFLLSITGLAVIGILLGNTISSDIPSDRLKKIFGWLSLCMGIWILIREL